LTFLDLKKLSVLAAVGTTAAALGKYEKNFEVV